MSLEKKLGIDSTKKRWLGLKVITISGLAAFGGGFFVWLGFMDIGRAIVIIGLVGASVGMLFHIVALAKTRFGLNKQDDNSEW